MNDTTRTRGSATTAAPVSAPPGRTCSSPAGEACLREDGVEQQAAAHGGARVRLEEHRVAQRQRGSHRADREDQRGVEGGHHPDHADRFAAGEGQPRRLARQHLTGRARGQRRGLVALLGGDVQLEVGLAGYRPGLPHQPVPQLVGVGGEQVTGAAQHGRPFQVGGPRPVALRRVGPYGGLRHVGRGRQADGGEGLPGGGFDHGGGTAGEGGSVLPEGRIEKRHGAGPPGGDGRGAAARAIVPPPRPRGTDSLRPAHTCRLPMTENDRRGNDSPADQRSRTRAMPCPTPMQSAATPVPEPAAAS